ncbi:MAG TPA: alpha-amylase family glycosyl hydrolase [Tepidisphaeraceae bacterium]|jgi:1,4-alpha-glucan branching enzyme|nr:alpha-amylase family glycosyl hydrolase [Tepidisphaeraceae bacterium]
MPSQLPGMGAIMQGGACSFRTWAPNAKQVSLAGNFNNWTKDQIWLFHEGRGFWSVDVQGPKAGDEYKFVIQNRADGGDNPGGEQWRTDPYSYDVPDSSANSNSIIIDLAAEMASSGLDKDPFATPSPADLIIYQVHVGSFAGYNDNVQVGDDRVAEFSQFSDKLDYIRGLGFNAIALLPDVENPGDVGAGYGPADFFAPESAYGSPESLRKMVKAAHDKGLAVIFDVVYNHAADVDNSLWELDGNKKPSGGIYFEGTDRTPWGPRPAHWKQEVRNFFLDHARMLLRDYRADGLRFDAAHEIQWECLDYIIRGIRAEPAWWNKYLIAEWDSGQTDRWWHVINNLGFDAIWGMNDPFAFRDAMDNLKSGDTAWRLGRLKTFIGFSGYPHAWNFIRYPLGSHDNIADGEAGGKPDHRYYVELAGGRGDWHARAKARLGWALAAAIPGTPMMFMGTETNQWGYWTANEDANPTHRDHRFDWNLLRTSEGEEMMRLVGAANAVRWQNPALRSDSLEPKHEDPANAVLAFKRWSNNGNIVLVVVNAGEGEWRFSDYGITMGGDTGGWREIFNSQAPYFGGYDCGNPGQTLWVQADGRLYINLPKWSVLMFVQE